MAYAKSSDAGGETGEGGARSAVRYLDAGEGDGGQRLDNYLLGELKGLPKSHLYRLLRKGEVRVNGKRVKPEQRLAVGDRIRIPPLREPTTPVAVSRAPGAALQQQVKDSIIYEDATLIALNKPAGIAVHGGSGLAHGVIETLRALRPDERELDLVHRLDRDTSGCLLVARRRAALRELHAQLREGQAEKRYLALLCGTWNLGQKRIDLPLATSERRGGERHVAVRGHGAPAVSTFRPVQFFGNVATLVEVDLGTGKTHQIRVHAAYAGHPVAGDDKYGDRERNADLAAFGLRRMFLHAASIGVTRPGTEEPLVISAPLPEDLKEVLAALERGARGSSRRKSSRAPRAPRSPRGAARR